MFNLSHFDCLLETKDIDFTNLKDIIPCFKKILFKEKYTHVVFKGGRGSGKTISVAKFLLLKCFDRKYANTNILALRQYQNSIQDSVKNELELLILKNNLTHYFLIQKQNITHIENNITFIFKGSDEYISSTARQKALQRDKIKGYTNVSFVWIEEAQSISESTLDVLIPTPRVQGLKSRFFYTMNPTIACDPVIKKISLRKNAVILHKNIFDIPKKYQNKNLLEEAEIDKNNVNFDHIWLGKPLLEIQGQPFLNVIETPILEDVFKPIKYLFIDPSFKGSDYTAICVCYKSRNYINVAGFCFRKAWNNCVIDIKNIINEYKVNYCFYEDNCLGDVVNDVFALEGVKLAPITNKENKINRIYRVAYLNSSLLLKSGIKHKIFNDQVRYYESEVSKSSMFNDDAPDALASCLTVMGY